jgi:hypothetical protein
MPARSHIGAAARLSAGGNEVPNMNQHNPELTDSEAHEMVVSIVGADFPFGTVDWQTVSGIAAPLLATPYPPTKAKAAASMVSLIRKNIRGMMWRGQVVNPETMAAIFDALSEGEHRGKCSESANGYHMWASPELNPIGSTPIRIPLKNKRCQCCGLQG